MNWLVLVCLLVGNTGENVLAARILAVLPITFRSHHIMFQAVLKTLAARGHQVVSYSPFPLDTPVENYTDVLLDTVPSTDEFLTKEMLDEWIHQSQVAVSLTLWNGMPSVLDFAFKSNKLIELLQSDETFDLVILESFFVQEVLIGFGHKFKAPVVSLLSFGSFHVVNRASGNSLCPSYIPDFSFSYSDHMSFYERFLNSYSIFTSLYTYYSHYLPSRDNLMRQIYNDSSMPPLVDMLHNISLFVNNAHPYVHYAQPYTPNMIPIGGIHLAKETKPLSQIMKTFLDEAKHGAIYFSLGSAMPDHLMCKKYFHDFISVFRRLPQRVVWKTGAELPDLPDNVMTVKWAPQQDILAHPNVSLFMTHGGLLSMHETINAEVPVVCIPFFGDQHLNARFFQEKAVGVSLPYTMLSEDTLYTSVIQVLNTTSYKDNMRKLSAIYRDRPVSPADSLVFWVEYVLRHRGAPHLRPASAAMPWYQLALLDVVGTFVTVSLISLFILYIIVSKLFSIIFVNRTKDNRADSLSFKKQN